MARRGRGNIVRAARHSGAAPKEISDLAFAAEQIELSLDDAAHLMRAVRLLADCDAANNATLLAVAAQAETIVDSTNVYLGKLARKLAGA